MFRKMVVLAFLVAGLAAIAASSGCGSRASSACDAGLRSLPALQAPLLLQPRSHDGTGSEEHGQRKSRPSLQSTIWQRSWTGSNTTSTSRIRRSLLPCKQKWSRLGKLTRSPNAKRALQRLQSNLRSRPSKIARPRWQSRRTRSPSWKQQQRKQPRQWRRPSRRLRNCTEKSTSYRKSTMRSWLALSSPRIQSQIHRATCVRRSRPFLGIPKPSLSLLSWKPRSEAFPACWRLQRPPPWRPRCGTTRNCSWTKRRTSRTMHWPSPEPSSGRCRVCPTKSERPRKRRWWSTLSKRGKFSHLKRHINTVYCACSVQAASGKGPSLESLAKILAEERLPGRESHQKTSWTITTANVTSWKSGQLMLGTIPHSDFWALQERHLPGSEQMATAQRWSRKRGWAASFQGAEVVGEHYAANRGGVAIAGPQHTSSSVPTEFEAMLGEAADLAPEGLEHSLQYLRSRILARHFHAMLKRGVTLVTVYLEPGLRASGLNLWLLEVLAACILCFDGPWIAM